MSPVNLVQVLISEGTTIAGQVFIKHAMVQPSRNAKFARSLTAGITSMAIGFFAWEALLKKFELSYLFPFDALNRILLVIAASVFLKEKATARIWAGVILITIGVLVVSGTEKSGGREAERPKTALTVTGAESGAH